MKRKDFLRLSTLAAAAAPFQLNGIPLNAFKGNGFLQQLAAASGGDRVLVLIQLHGGNDGLNTVVPIDQYSQYYNLRPNIAIPQSGARRYITLDNSLPSNQQIGLHTDMTGAKAMYDDGNMVVVQNVSYENMNGSHFRSRDIWFMGGDYDDYLASGWMGRYLDYYYPGYPTGYPSTAVPDPLALEIGYGISLAFHRGAGIPLGISVQNPDAFYNLINSVGVNPPITFPDSHAGDEIEYIMQMEQQANQYALRLKDVYDAGSNSSVVYPDLYPFVAPASSLHNPLAPQLKIVSRLLSGGCGTKIFLCRIGGFDTHANQVLNTDTTMGGHAARLYHVSAAVKAFYDDLQALGLSDRVLTMTFSEFGRRAASNASYGTDHGNAAPMLIFGKCLNGGVYGTNPDLSNLSSDNVPLQFDYRQVFTSVVKDWFGAPQAAIQQVMFDNWVDNRVDFVNCKLTSTSEVYKDRLRMACYPNPARTDTTISYYIDKPAEVTIDIRDLHGKVVLNLLSQKMEPGPYTKKADLSSLSPGTYVITLQATHGRISDKLLVVR